MPSKLGYDFTDDLMWWLNTLEDKIIPKTWVYEWAMRWRPKNAD